MKNFTKSILNVLLKKRCSFLELALMFLVMFLVLDTVTLWSVQRALKKTTPLPQISIVGESTFPAENAYLRPYEFSDDMFTHKIPVWEKVLEPFKGKPEVQYLEIGVHEGRSALWMLDNVLTHPTSHLTGVDIFADEYKGRSGGYKKTYLANLEMSGAAERTTTIEGYSQVELRKLPLNSFGLIYIDGSHVNADVLEDAVLCWRLLKDNGLLIFDDYGSGLGNPKLGIEAFTRYFGSHFDVIHNSYQLILRKRPRQKAIEESQN